MKTKLITFIALLFIPASLLLAAESKKDELQQRFKERYPAIQELKSKGAVGETDEGYIDWVEKRDAKSADLIDQENADRRELYTSIAKKTGETPEVVAKHNAQRSFEKAKPGEFLKVGGKWHQKEK